MAENETRKKEILEQLRNREEIFVLLSKCTRMPFVSCDPETYNDQVFIFGKKEDAAAVVSVYEKEQISVEAIKVLKKKFLSFYSSLFFIGVNAIVIDKGPDQLEIQITELVTPPDYSQLPEGKVRVDNPAFQLTALYLMQELRKEQDVEQTPDLQELQEELIVNMRKGTYIVPVQDDKQIPFLKLQDGGMLQPVFTDISEFSKFNTEQKFRGAVLSFPDLGNILIEHAKGIVINPYGVHVVILREQLK